MKEVSHITATSVDCAIITPTRASNTSSQSATKTNELMDTTAAMKIAKYGAKCVGGTNWLGPSGCKYCKLRSTSSELEESKIFAALESAPSLLLARRGNGKTEGSEQVV